MCWVLAAGAGFTWAALLVLTTQQFLHKDEPGLNSELPSGVIRALQSKVNTLEHDLSLAHKDVDFKDRLIASLRMQLETADSEAGQKAQPDVAQRSDLGESQGSASQLRGVRTFGPSEPALPGSSGLPAAAASPLSPSASCDFQEGFDVQVHGGSATEAMVKDHSTPEECCKLCMAKNSAAAGSCTVAVLSSAADAPPRACWIKSLGASHVQLSSALRTVGKPGVVACFPPGHGPIPTAKPEPASSNALEHEKRVAMWQQPTSVSSQEIRTNAVRDAIRHAWSGYTRLAWGMDELTPLVGRGRNKGFNHAVTMVDALDTLWIAGLKDEFHEAKDWLAGNLPKKISAIGGGTSVFETTIRSLGGLLSAYDLSKEKVFLDLAVQLGNRIIGVVKPQGVTPYTFGGGRGGMNCASLAESGTSQLEMRYLSQVTGDPAYAEKVMEFYSMVQRHKGLDGLWPNCYDKGRGKMTMGADGDSFYEYLLKVFVQGGAREEERFLWRMYEGAVDGMEKHLVQKGADGLTYLGTFTWDGGSGGSKEQEMEHLTCFVPGWLALGATVGAKHDLASNATRSHWRDLADQIAYTCWQMYEQQPTGIGPERVKGHRMDLKVTNTREYILRPEAVEGWWYLSELTQDPKYREWGWKTFVNFEKWLWHPNGYASLKDVRDTSKKYIDRMESFFLAETMKYLYLLQDPDHQIKLDRYVFNTEAHPLSLLDLAPRPA